MIQLMRVCTEFSEQSLQFKIKLHDLYNSYFTAPFNNMRTLKFKAQLTNGFFATVHQMFSGSYQLLTTAEHWESSNTSALLSELCSMI